MSESNMRATTMFGDSYVFVVFEDGTDLYWARACYATKPTRGELMMARWGMQTPPLVRPSWRKETFSCKSKKGKTPAFVT